MPLITCPDCQHDISDAAHACIHCGRPLVSASVLLIPETRYRFFPVAPHKFIVLSLCTLNFYTLYWCYHNWRRIGERGGEHLSPFWRAVFAPVWIFSLFGRIAEQGRERGLEVSWSPTFLGLTYLIMSALGLLPDPWWLVGLAGFVPFLPVVQTIQRLNHGETATEGHNTAYSGANLATILVGGLILLLAVVGTFMNEEEQEYESLPESTGWTSSRTATASFITGSEAGFFTF
jgi:hypothetical protein